MGARTERVNTPATLRRAATYAPSRWLNGPTPAASVSVVRDSSFETRDDARQALLMLAVFIAALTVVFFTLVQPERAPGPLEDTRAPSP